MWNHVNMFNNQSCLFAYVIINNIDMLKIVHISQLPEVEPLI